MVNRFLQQCLFALAPGVCLLCRQASGRPRDLCLACEKTLPWLTHCCSRCALPLPVENTGGECGQCQSRPPTFSRCLAPWRYDFPLDHLITDFKHRGQLVSGRILAELWLEHKAPQLGEPLPDLIIPVPLHWRRRWQRGFNQSLLLARHWSNALNVPIGHPLQRTRSTPAQQGLSAKDRQRNLRDAFTLRGAHLLQDKHIALVDDVLTTGATANTLASILARNGVRQTDIWCLARTP